MKKILIIQGHPDKESYCYALAEAYRKGAVGHGTEVSVINTGEIDFDPNLRYGYRKRMELEKSLLEAQEKISEANHLVFIFPVWWGMVPAVLKGFLDRVLLPDFAFRKRKDSLWWDKYLKGRTGRIISTMDQPTWYYRWFNKMPSTYAMKKLTMQFCGIANVKVTHIGPVRNSSDKFRAKWLKKIEAIGMKDSLR